MTPLPPPPSPGSPPAGPAASAARPTPPPAPPSTPGPGFPEPPPAPGDRRGQGGPAAHRSPRPVVLAAPAAVGLGAGLVLLARLPTRNLYAETRLWIAAVTTGLLVSGVLVVVTRARTRAARAWDAGRRAAAEAAAAEHQRFLLRLDHELKNPVTAIQAGLANLSSLLAPPGSPHPPPDSPAGASATALHTVSAQARRLADLVADLRKLAELETRPLERAPVELAEVLTEAHEAALELPGADERTITLVLPQAPW
ncbi:MAG TPA: histidine kinase dimerization/phospho-acceptor domain-containing protein, partial [Acidimicrobiales bacterium]